MALVNSHSFLVAVGAAAGAAAAVLGTWSGAEGSNQMALVKWLATATMGVEERGWTVGGQRSFAVRVDKNVTTDVTYAGAGAGEPCIQDTLAAVVPMVAATAAQNIEPCD